MWKKAGHWQFNPWTEGDKVAERVNHGPEVLLGANTDGSEPLRRTSFLSHSSELTAHTQCPAKLLPQDLTHPNAADKGETFHPW